MFPTFVAETAEIPVGPLPQLFDVDPVLVGIIAVLLLIVFVFFLLIRRTVKSFTEGMRKGRK